MAQRNNMNGVAETFDVFGNKVGGTSVRVHHQPGGASSFSLGGNYYGEDNNQQQNNRQNAAGGAVQKPFGTQDEEEKDEEQKQQQQNAAAAGGGANSASAGQGAVPGNNSGNVAEAFDVFGNKVSGTSVRVRAPPGGASSITF